MNFLENRMKELDYHHQNYIYHLKASIIKIIDAFLFQSLRNALLRKQ